MKYFAPKPFAQIIKRFNAAPGSSKVAVLAPGAPSKGERLEKGIDIIKEVGVIPHIFGDPSEFYGRYDFLFSNGSVQERVDYLHQAFADPDIVAIIAARGSYGSAELLSRLDLELLRANPKPLIGFSDVTALLVALATQAETPTIHGPTLTGAFAEFRESEAARESVDELVALLRGQTTKNIFPCKPVHACSFSKEVHVGKALAGNLTVLTSLLGTKWFPDTKDLVLFLEDCGEAPYRIHRMLLQLKLAGALDHLSALVFGRFSRCAASHGPSVEETIARFVRDELTDALTTGAYPVLSNFPFGHDGLNIPIILGEAVAVTNDTVNFSSR